MDFNDAEKIRNEYESKKINFSDDFIKGVVKKSDIENVGLVPYENLKLKNGHYVSYYVLFKKYYADLYGVTPSMISHIIKRRSLIKEASILGKIEKKCIECGKKYYVWPCRKDSLFCSSECHNNYRNDILICPGCGKEFKSQKYKKQIYCSQSCFYSSANNGSIGECQVIDFIRSLGVNVLRSKRIYHKKGFFIPDVFVPEKNLIIEFFGEYWHASEKIFEDENKTHPQIKKKVIDIRNRDKLRKKTYEESGYIYYLIWEFDWMNKREKIKKEIRSIINEN